MLKSKIGTIEAIALVLSVLAPFTVISLSRTFINETKSSALLNIIYVTSICLFIAFLIYVLFKKFPGLDIIDVSGYLGGNIFKNIIGFVFIAYFLHCYLRCLFVLAPECFYALIFLLLP